MAESRKERGLTQSLFLIETFPSEEKYMKQFAVMGTTGNVYNVSIKEKPECTCPDYLKRERNCKHIYFILLKVMQIRDQRTARFSKEELTAMFTHIPHVTSNLIVNSTIRDLYKSKVSELQKDEEKEGTIKQKSTNDLCPICLENLEDGNELDYCRYGCGKSIHKLCFEMWCRKNQPTCVFCRTSWKSPSELKRAAATTDYINLNLHDNGNDNPTRKAPKSYLSRLEWQTRGYKGKRRWKNFWDEPDEEEEDEEEKEEGEEEEEEEEGVRRATEDELKKIEEDLKRKKEEVKRLKKEIKLSKKIRKKLLKGKKGRGGMLQKLPKKKIGKEEKKEKDNQIEIKEESKSEAEEIIEKYRGKKTLQELTREREENNRRLQEVGRKEQGERKFFDFLKNDEEKENGSLKGNNYLLFLLHIWQFNRV